MSIRAHINVVESAQNVVYHVTDRSRVASILRNGFQGGHGDIGFGVYFWTDFGRADEFATAGGWDGGLSDPVIIQVSDPEIEALPFINPEWDSELYNDMAWKPMDEDDDEAFWKPHAMEVMPD